MGEIPRESEKQRVWRTFSESNHNGYFIWEILEVMGEITPQRYFTECSDGSYIMIQCHHFWTKEQAEKALRQQFLDEWQTVITID